MSLKNANLKLYIIGCAFDKKLKESRLLNSYEHLIQAGAALTDKRIYELNDHDDFYESISNKNQRYSEMTAMFWLRYNSDADYIGIEHYRRRFNISEEKYREYLEQGFDVITTPEYLLPESIEENFEKHHYANDWALMYEAIEAIHPDDAGFVHKYFSDARFRPCNMNIWKRELYDEYCDWLFPVLDYICSRSPEKFDLYERRDIGFIGERLTSFYVEKIIKNGCNVFCESFSVLDTEKNIDAEIDYCDSDAVWKRCEELYAANRIANMMEELAKIAKENRGESDKISNLFSMVATAYEEQKYQSMTMYEYLPAKWKESLDIISSAYNSLGSILKVISTGKQPDAIAMFEEFLDATHFSEIAIRCQLKNMGISNIAEDFCKKYFHNGINDNEKYHRLAAVLIAKDEDIAIEEWLEYHLLKGIQHFYIYDNGSAPSFKKILKPYIDEGLVTYHWFPGEVKQLPAYNHAINHYKYDNEYMAFIDTDEFIVTMDDRNIYDVVTDIIAEYENGKYKISGHVGGVAINWRNYGTSWFEGPSDELLIESHTLRAEDNFSEHVHIKTICNPRVVEGYNYTPHNCVYRQGYYTISENGSYIPNAFFYDGRCNKIRINHYYMKSRSEYIEKVKRGWPIVKFEERSDEWADKMFNSIVSDCNKIEDSILVKYADEVKTRIESRHKLIKKFSVIVCCYNVADYIDVCMNQLIHQTIGLENMEIILVNDGSNDEKTSRKLREYEAKYTDNVILIENESNIGLGASRNVALKYATGEYLAYCDADDWFSIDAFKELYDIAKNDGADVVEFKYKDVYEHNGKCPNEISDTGDCCVYLIDSIVKRKEFALPPDSSIVLWTRIYRTDFLKQNNIRVAECATYEEPEFTYMVRLLEKVHVNVEKTFYYYLQRPGSNRDKYFECIEEVWKPYIGYIQTAKEKGIYEACKDEIDFTFWSGIFYLPMVNLAKNNCFYTKEQYKKLQYIIKESIADIRNNIYWKQYFSVVPVLGDITYVDIDRINIGDIQELFAQIAKG